MMPKRKAPKKGKRPLALILGLLFINFAAILYLYIFILPFEFPNQWQPTQKELSTSGKYDQSNETGVFHNEEVRSYPVPDTKEEEVLGENVGAEKRIEVDLTNQKVYAFEGGNKVFDFLISSGKWGKTPTGTFTITYKTRAQLMKGGSKELGTYYYLPNVQYVEFFGNKEIPWSRGFSFHGAYWHNNFGHPMSHGCINMRNEDAQQLYYWTTPDVKDKGYAKASTENPGTKVVIYGVAPNF